MEIKADLLKEIIALPAFREAVKKHLSKIIHAHHIRPAPKPGYRYKRDWYDRMGEASQLNTSFFLKHIESIWLKKSLLNHETRQVIQAVCAAALEEVIMVLDHAPEVPEVVLPAAGAKRKEQGAVAKQKETSKPQTPAK